MLNSLVEVSPWFIGAGLCGVLLAAVGCEWIVLTSVSCIALGASGAVARHGASRPFGLLTAQLGVYLAIYALFLGAKVHAGAMETFFYLDLVASLFVLGLHVSLLRDQDAQSC